MALGDPSDTNGGGGMLDVWQEIESGNIGTGMNSDAWNAYASNYLNAGSGINWGDLVKKYGSTAANLIGAGLGASGLLNSSPQKTGYQGKIPILSATRQQLPIDYNAPRRPGSGGRRYFTDMTYAPKAGIASVAPGVESPVAPAGGAPVAAVTPYVGPDSGQPRVLPHVGPDSGRPFMPLEHILPYFGPDSGQPLVPLDNNTYAAAAHGGMIGYAQGGLADLGYYLGGKTDGMADKIPAQIDDKQQAKLSHGEFVISADVVSALGSGNSSAGAKVLYDMMDRIRKHAHGTTKQIKPANLKKVLPA